MKKTFNIADDLHDWYKMKSDKTGIPVTTLMMVAMERYREQEQALNTNQELLDMLKKLELKNKEDQ